MLYQYAQQQPQKTTPIKGFKATRIFLVNPNMHNKESRKLQRGEKYDLGKTSAVYVRDVSKKRKLEDLYSLFEKGE